jgi:hypothetical protein
MESLKNVSTFDLTEELRGREGVDVTVVDPHSNITILVSGPAHVFVVTD